MIDIDKAKAYLGQAYRIDLQIASKEEQIRMWESLAEKVTAGTNGIGNTGAGNRTEEYAKIRGISNEDVFEIEPLYIDYSKSSVLLDTNIFIKR